MELSTSTFLYLSLIGACMDYYADYEKKNPAKFKRRFDISLLEDPYFLRFIQTRNAFVLKERKKIEHSVTICDIGAGTGLSAIELKRHLGPEDFVAEIDYSHHLLTKFESKGKICADGMRMPFLDNTFDIVYCMDFLHHIEDIEQGVREMLRVSKDKVIILEPNKFNPIYFLYSLVNKEERGILHVGYKKILRFAKTNNYELEFVEPFPFHLWLMKTPYAWLSKLFGTLRLRRLFASYVLIIQKSRLL